jgi:hypothetical protein
MRQALPSSSPGLVITHRLHAVKLNKREMVTALLAANADSNATQRNGDAALHTAAYAVREGGACRKREKQIERVCECVYVCVLGQAHHCWGLGLHKPGSQSQLGCISSLLPLLDRACTTLPRC